MSSPHVGSGVFVLSIDLGTLPVDRAPTAERRSALSALLRLLAQYHLPATFIGQEIAQSGEVTAILDATAAHDVALTIDVASATVGAAAVRETLVAQIRQAKASGIPLAAVVWRGPRIDGGWELLADQGLTAVCQEGAAGDHDSVAAPAVASSADLPERTWQRVRQWLALRNHQAPRPRCLRRPLWDVPVSQHLPTGDTWHDRAVLGQIGRQLERLAALGGVCHLRTTLADFQTHAVVRKGLQRMLAKVAALSDRRQLRVATLAETGALLAQRNSPRSSHSILRKPAA